MKKIIPIYILTLVLAAASIMYELIIANTIASIAANAVMWYSLTIGLYLLAMGIGAFYSERAQKKYSLLLTLFYTEVALVIIGGFAVSLLHIAQMLHVYLLVQEMSLLSMIVFPFIAGTLISIIGFLSGIELPLLIRLGEKTSGKNIANRILAVDYIGSLVGALLVPIVLIPLLSPVLSGFATASINLIATIVILFVYMGNGRVRDSLAMGFLTSILGISMFYATSIENFFIQKYYLYGEAGTSFVDYMTPSETVPILRVTSPYQRIDFFYSGDEPRRILLNHIFSSKFEADPYYPLGYHLFINGDFQSLSNTDDIYHEWFAHYPIIANGSIPKNVLVLGAGDGLLSKELLKYRGIETITQVELDPKMIELARTNPTLSYMNKHSLDNPRINIILGDAYMYVKNTPHKYDAVYVDFPYANDYNLARLYSREFYSFVREVLNEDGFMIFDAPGADLYKNFTTNEVVFLGDIWYTHYNTLRSAGFNTIYPYASILETENKEAFDALDALDLPIVNADGTPVIADAQTMQTYEHTQIRKAIKLYSDSSNQSFIMAKRNGEIIPMWKDNGVTLYSLTEDRFNLSTNLPYPMAEEIDSTRINSIMRPLFDSGPKLMLRRPY